MALAMCCAQNPLASAEVRLPALISDHMVLQQQGPARIWGWASPGEHVTVSFAGQSPSATADATGHWSVWLTSLKPGKSSDMTIAGTNTLVVHDVLVGEVWVGSGQSNMERAVHFSPDEARINAQAKDDEVRLFMVRTASPSSQSRTSKASGRPPTPAASGTSPPCSTSLGAT